MITIQVDVDLNSGRSRLIRKIAGIAINEHVSETQFSRWLASEDPEGLPPKWRTDSASSFYSNSPNYEFHGVLSGLEKFSVIALKCQTPDEMRRLFVRQIGNAMKSGDASRLEESIKKAIEMCVREC